MSKLADEMTFCLVVRVARSVYNIFLPILLSQFSNCCYVQRKACLPVTPNKVHRKPMAALQRRFR